MQPTQIPVEEFTTPDPVTAREDLSIDELQALMKRHAIRHLPVVRGDVVVGLISDRDVRLVSGLSLAEAPDLERYESRFDEHTGNGGVEIWLPVDEHPN